MATDVLVQTTMPLASTFQDDNLRAACELKVICDQKVLEATKQQVEEGVVACAEPAELDGADNPLSDVVRMQAERIKELEHNLADARKIIHNREQLLAELQWKPKEDYYAWKNPTINDKTVKDAQERKFKVLLEQMRLMEKMLAERDQVLHSLVGGQSLDNLSPSKRPTTSRTPTDSPFDSPASFSSSSSSIGSARSSPGDEKKSWWTLRKSSSNSSIKSSPGGTPSRLSPAGTPSSANMRGSGGSHKLSPNGRVKDHIV